MMLWQTRVPDAVERMRREDVRLKRARILIRGNFNMGLPDAFEVAIASERYASAKEFFDVAFSKPMRAEEFIGFVEMFHAEPSIQVSPWVGTFLRQAIETARLAEKPFIKGGGEDLMVVDPRAAIEWLLSLPTERALIPKEILTYVEGGCHGPDQPGSEPASSLPKQDETYRHRVSDQELERFLMTLPAKTPKQTMRAAAREKFGRRIRFRQFESCYGKLPSDRRRRPGERD